MGKWGGRGAAHYANLGARQASPTDIVGYGM